MSARIWQARIRSQIDILPSGAKARLRQYINDIDRLEPAQETGRPDCSGLLETFCRIADSGGPSAPGKWQEAQRELALVLHHLADHCDIPPTLKQIAYDGASGEATLAGARQEVEFLKAALDGTKPPDEGTIIALGERRYRIGNVLPVVIDDNEDSVLQAFLEQTPMDSKTLIDKAGFDRAPRVLSNLREKYNGMFAVAIRCPGAKGRGGYHVTIQAAPE